MKNQTDVEPIKHCHIALEIHRNGCYRSVEQALNCLHLILLLLLSSIFYSNIFPSHLDQGHFVCSDCKLNFDQERVLRNHIFDQHVSRFKREFFQGDLVEFIDDGHDYNVMEKLPNEWIFKVMHYVDGQPMIAYVISEKLEIVNGPKENQLIYYETGVRPIQSNYVDSLISARMLEIVYDTDFQCEMFVVEKLSTGWVWIYK